MKNKILQGFTDSNIKIKSLEKLEQYINYCVLNNQQDKIKGKTSYHHILPEALFDKYSNLKNNPWNGTHLLYYDHYYAHWLLTEAIDDYGQLSAFTKMHNMDYKSGRIKEQDLIPKEEFQLKMEERSIKQVEWLNAKVELEDGSYSTNAKIRGKKQSITKNKTYIHNGKTTTLAKEMGLKHSELLNREYLDENGGITTKGKEGAKKAAKTRMENGKIYDLYHIDKGLIKEGLYLKEIKNMYRTLPFSTSDNYIGKSNRSHNNLMKNEKQYLLGCYVKEIIK